MTKKILSIAVLIIILILTGVLSFSYGYKMGGENNFQSSEVIQARNVLASGEITEISGRTLTLASGQDTLAIPIREKARVAVSVPGEKAREMEFNEIKVGDKTEVLIELKPDGSFEGINIMVFPGQK